MMPSHRSIGVGAFVVGGLVLFALGLFMIGERRFFFARVFEVEAEFAQVAGLQDGAGVRVNGMVAGEVNDILIPPSPAGRFRVRMRLQEELRPLVRHDSTASIRTDGIVGGRYVHIEAGSEQSPVVTDGAVIRGREPFDFADLLEQGTATIANVNTVIGELRGHLNDVVGLVRVTATNANDLVTLVAKDVEAIGRAGRTLSEETTRIVEGIRAGRGTIGKLVNDDELYNRVAGIASEAEQAARAARVAADSARATIARLQSGSSAGAVEEMVSDLRQTLSYTRDAMANIADNTEALKRNVLVRGFFDERGYYDLDTLTPVDYREGALAGKHREPIRVWLRSDLLFTTPASPAQDGANPSGGRETLSPDGRARIDRAMAEVLRYPRNTPLIVESYAAAATRDAQLRLAGDRSRVVRDYIINRYGVSPSLVGTMPMTEPPLESPTAGEWDGISLAAWVDRRTLAPGRE
jgi:phospholipid/cholesterol/gamma-HCH transport system substrate-binding protein